MKFSITTEDLSGVDQADVEAPDMDAALIRALDELGQPLEGRDEGDLIIRIRVGD